MIVDRHISGVIARTTKSADIDLHIHTRILRRLDTGDDLGDKAKQIKGTGGTKLQ